MKPIGEWIRGSPWTARVATGAFWSVMAAVISRGFGLLTWMIVARLLGRKVFGELGILQNTFGLLQNLSLFGLGIMATRYVAQYRASEKQRAGRVVGLSVLMAAASGTLMGLAAVSAAPWIAARVLGAPHLAGVLEIGAILVVVYTVTGVLEGALAGFEAFRQMAMLAVISGVVSLPLYVWAAWRAGLEGVVWVMVGTGLIVLALDYWVLRAAARKEGCAVSFRGGRRELRALFGFSLPVFLSSQTFFGAEWLGNWLLIRQPSGFGELGIYSAAARWQQAVLFVPQYVGRAIFPGLTERYGAGDHSAFKQMLKHYLFVCNGIAVACAAVLSLVSKWIMSGYGSEFTQGWPILVIVAVTMVFLPLRWAIQMIYRSIGTVWYEFLLGAAWAVTLLVCMLTLPLQGAMRLAVSTLIAFALTTLAGAVHTGLRLRRRAWHASTA